MESDEPGIRFKAKKRTKTLRQRDRDPSPDTTTTSTIIAAAPDAPVSDNDHNSNEEAVDGAADASSSVQAALKLRQSRTKHRFRGGVGFGRNEPAAHASSNDDTSLILRDAATTVAQGLPDRFMHQTGFIADADDRHMTAYVESRLSSRRGASAEQQQQQQQNHLAVHDGGGKRTEDMRRKTNAPGTVQTGTSTTSWTRLVEVQVPADLRSNNNNNNNNNSKKRSLDAADTTKQNPPRRRRNRRGSDDMKRDAMVEAFLHENKLDVYDVSDASAAANDDALAENFRQQYMQEVAARRQRRRPALNQPRMTQKQQAHQQAVAAGEVLKGPKLGGSRNARAAVRDALLQQQELRKKGK
ncbi:hypothetical protein BM221_008338 [Beauveria bassiana]|uniref:mRNA splicing factor RNA helicase n=1 Tax=Beauveria bassiana TaxID=176275 RepID=A0A2N6NFZ5_BEABA|nr:hypothetical protein BM221_008338 [Beauveria bassiana]